MRRTPSHNMSFLSRLHQDLRNTRLTRRGATHRPEDVPRGIHKEYSRMERVLLPPPTPLTQDLSDVLAERSSYHEGNSESYLSLQEVSDLLGHALRKRPGSINRNYPSGGALYPVETYFITVGITGTSMSGVFHYHPSLHALEHLWQLPGGFDIKTLARHPVPLLFSSLVVFTAVWSRSSAKYGDLAYQHALLEAGHMSQNVLLVATATSVSARPYAGFDDERIVSLLDIDPDKEQPVHSIPLSRGGTYAYAESERLND